MILIDRTYFVGELSLPNIPATTGGGASGGVAMALQTVGENNLDVFVDKYVIDYLIRLLGKELAQAFLEEIEKPTPDQIWTDLKSQLLIKFGSYNRSPLANYVYFMVSRDAVTKTTTGGEADPEFDFAKNVSNNNKLIKAWNDMADMTIPIKRWICEYADDYKDFMGCSSGRNICSIIQRINEFGI